MKHSILLTSFLCLLQLFSQAQQQFTQTIRGQIVDKETQSPIAFADILILDSNSVKGASTNEDGYYKIQNVPVGRVNIRFTFLGYEPVYRYNIEVTTGKEVVLNVEMIESVEIMNEVVVTDEIDKTGTINKMATVSARTFSTEETGRYAGSLNDVSRMAMNFAGVQSANDAVNDIVIRGNSPSGLLWRFEGIDIPNPNHFGDGGATGGPISMLNNNVLDNSDFFTGAFPAEYGNALSGVFDLHMRNGNNEKHEFLGQIGFNGFEFGAEGPINKKNYSSYLVNYRYSTLGLMVAMGMNFGTGTAIPKYQDFNYKINFPKTPFGAISFFGIGGKSNISFLDSQKDSSEIKPDFYGHNYQEDIINNNDMLVTGITNKILLGEKAYIHSTIAFSAIKNNYLLDSLSTINRANIPWWRANNLRSKIAVASFVNIKINAKNSLRSGIFIDYLFFNMVDSLYNASAGHFEIKTKFKAQTFLIQPYTQWQIKLTPLFTINSGIHAAVLGSNGSFAVEPRFGLKWKFHEKQSLSFGYGMHSQVAPIEVLQRQVFLPNGSYAEPNKNIGFTHSQHMVLGYDLLPAKLLRFKIEAYYQMISDAIVSVESSSYSLLNRGSFSFVNGDSLKNGGTGTNIGVEFTLEKFLNKGSYFLITTSLFNSTYTGSDNIQRNTAFNGGFVLNLLAGQELELFKKKENRKHKHKLIFDVKFNWAGGQRYTPIDLSMSQLVGSTQYIDSLAYSSQLADYIRFDIRLGYRLSGKKITQEWAFDVENVTDHKNPLYNTYNTGTASVESIYQLGLFPVVLYKINF